MSRRSPLGFVISLALEVALVVLIVSVLPRVDLRGGRAGGTPQPSDTADFGSRATVQPITETSLKFVRDTEPADAPPRLTPIGAIPSRAAEPPPLINRDLINRDVVPIRDSWPHSERPAVDVSDSRYAEQRLDRASQTLLNGLGSYVARAAGHLLQPDEQAASPGSAAPGSAASATPIAVPHPVAPPAFSSSAPVTRSTPPQIVIPAPAAGNAPPAWTGSFPTQPAPSPPAAPPAAPQSRFVRWRNY